MKPIIFSTPMVQAILDGKKTQTRRVVKINGCPITSPKESLELTKEGLIYHSFCSMSGYYKPLCQPGDILWVRESWCENRGKYFYKADNICNGCTEDGICLPEGVAKHITCELCEDRDGYIKWRPSIHMPRTAARIFLRVTNVRVERLQEISKEDIIAEGSKLCNEQEPNRRFYYGWGWYFRNLWDSLNAKRGYGWATNPWVWVYEFEKINQGKSAIAGRT